MKYEVKIINESLSRTIHFTCDSFLFKEEGIIHLKCRDNGDVSFRLENDEKMIVYLIPDYNDEEWI